MRVLRLAVNDKAKSPHASGVEAQDGWCRRKKVGGRRTKATHHCRSFPPLSPALDVLVSLAYHKQALLSLA